MRKSLSTLLFVLLGLAAGCANSHQREFASPDEAVQSFVTAMRTNDDAALHDMFGPSADELMSSGDPVADQLRRQKFLDTYDESNQLVPGDSPNSMTLVIGTQAWPLPIPVVKDDSTGQWRFDTEAGKDEIINRRIGQNELDVIQVCKAFVDAEQEYAERDPENIGVPVYAYKAMSDPGKRNGLYWETKEGEPPSPLGPFVADAVDQGYFAKQTDKPQPYHGYFYRMLDAQGPNAQGGAREYVVNDRMIGGFAAVAYPADYGNSGIMTFIVNQDGVVYQKDLGDDTAKLAKAMKSFDPGSGWQNAESPATNPSPAPSPQPK